MCPQGPKRVSLFMSEHTIHSSSDSMLLFRDGLRVPTWPLEQKSVCERERATITSERAGENER